MKNQIKGILEKLLGHQNYLMLNVHLIDFTGSHEKALLLSQMVYWTGKSELEGGWVAKSYEEWYDELRLKKPTVYRAMLEFKEAGFLQTQIKKFNGTPILHFRLDLEIFAEHFSKGVMLQNAKSDVSNCNIPLCQIETSECVDLQQTIYKETEITTEITAESNNTREENFENQNTIHQTQEPEPEPEPQKLLNLTEFFTLEPNQKIRDAIFGLFDIGNDFEHGRYHRKVNHFMHRLHELDIGGFAPGILERFKSQFRAYYKYILGDKSRNYAGKGKKFRYTLDNFLGCSWETTDLEKLREGFEDGQWHVKDWYEVLKSEIDYANKNLVNA